MQEMEKKGILCFVVALLGIISAGAGFAAEATRVKVKIKHQRVFFLIIGKLLK